ncbi:unnamed protein product, partial [Mesorhabditis spiculigera]
MTFNSDEDGDAHDCLTIVMAVDKAVALHRFECGLSKPSPNRDAPFNEVISGFETTPALDRNRCLRILEKFTGILPGHPVALRNEFMVETALRVCLWPTGEYSPADYLDIYIDAIHKLRGVPRIRFNQMYWRKSDCLGSLAVVEQLIRYIVKNTPTGAQTQVIAFRTLLYEQRPDQVSIFT